MVVPVYFFRFVFLMKQYDFFVPTIENRDEFWIQVCFNFCSD